MLPDSLTLFLLFCLFDLFLFYRAALQKLGGQ